MRGKRFISAVLLGAIFSAQFLFTTISAPQVVKADPSTLPGDTETLLTQFATTISALNDKDAFDYYNTHVKGKNPITYGEFNNAAAASAKCNIITDDGTDKPRLFKNVHASIYCFVGQMDEDFENTLSLLKDYVTAPGTTYSFDAVNAKVEERKRYILKNAVPFIGYQRASLKILAANYADTRHQSEIIANINDQNLLNDMLTDLDPRNSKRLKKIVNLEDALKNGGNVSSSDKIYTTTDGTGGWYPDAVKMYNAVLNAAPITDQASLDTFKASVLAAAAEIDASSGGANESSVVGKNDVCGDASGLGALNLGLVIRVALCEMVVAVRDLFLYLLKSSMGLLIITAGIPDSGISTGTRLSNTPLLFDGLQGTVFEGRVEEKLISGNEGAVARAAYNRVLNFANGGVLLLLIIIALANILQVQVNVYSFKKLLPGLVIGLLLANASFLIVRAMLEVSGYTASGLISKDQVKVNINGKTAGPVYMLDQFVGFGTVGGNENTSFWDSTKNEPNMGKVFQQFILNIFILAAAILVLILGFLFAIRSLIFLLLLPLAPLAFIGLYFPPLGAVWKRWWAMVINWTFMPVVAFFWLWLGFMWMASVPPQGSGIFSYLLNYVFGIAMIYMAMKTPFTLAGEAKTVLNKWNDIGKGVGKYATPYGAGLRAYNSISDNMKDRSKLTDKGPIFQNKFAKKLGGDYINKKQYQSELKTEMLKAQQAADEEKLKGDAFKEMVDGKEGLITKWKKSNNDFIRGLGETLDSKAGRWATGIAKAGVLAAINPAALALMAPDIYRGFKSHDGSSRFGTAGQKALEWAENLGDMAVKNDLVAPLSYSARQAQIRHTKEAGKRAKNAANSTLDANYFKGEAGVERAQLEFEAAAQEKASEKVKKDAQTAAAHRYITSHTSGAAGILDSIDAIRTAGGVDYGVNDLNALMNYKPTDQMRQDHPELAAEIKNFQDTNKPLYKSSTKHISSAAKSDVEDNAKKEISEIVFADTETDKVARVMRKLNVNDTQDVGVDGVAPTDVSDITARLGGLAKIAGSTNQLDKIQEGLASLNALEAALTPADPALTHPDDAQFKAEIAAFRTVVNNPIVSREELQRAAGTFKASGVYKEIMSRVTTPQNNYRHT